MAVDLAILLFIEFNLVAIIQISNITPGSLAHLFLLVKRRAYIRRTLLELHRIRAGVSGGINNFFCSIQITVVINTDLCDDISGVPITHHSISKFNFTSHFQFSF